MSERPSPLDTAIAYIGRGWSPVPVPFMKKGPTLDDWQLLRITRETADGYFNGQPQNVGCILGHASDGLTDIDLDCAEAAAAAPFFLPKTAALFGRKSTRMAHWLYRTDLASQNLKAVLSFKDPRPREGRKPTLLELRIGGDKGAQTVFPGSTHESGELIEWEPGCAGEPAEVDGHDLHWRVARLAACTLLARYWPPHGARHDARLGLAGVLSRAGFSEPEALVFVEALARAVGDEDVRDAKTAVRSTYVKAARGDAFNAFPKLCEAVSDEIGKWVADWLGYDENSPEWGAPPQDERQPKESMARVKQEIGSEKSVAAPPAPKPRVILPTPFEWRDPATIPMREWVYGQHLIRKYVSVTAAPGGVGKSALALVEALAMVTGRSLLGEPPTDKLRVWYWNGEDDLEELQRRIMAICKHYKITAEGIGCRLFVSSGRDLEICIGKVDPKKGYDIDDSAVNALVDGMKKRECDVFIADPFISSHSIPENDNSAIDAVVKKGFGAVADRANCAVELIHHARKLGGHEMTIDAVRGGSAIAGAVRSGRVLNPLSEDDAKKVGITEDLWAYFRAHIDKGNMAPVTRQPKYYRMMSVALENGELLEGDSIGVVTRFDLPEADEVETVLSEGMEFNRTIMNNIDATAGLSIRGLAKRIKKPFESVRREVNILIKSKHVEWSPALGLRLTPKGKKSLAG